MNYGQGGPRSQWDPWKPNSEQPWSGASDGRSPDWAALAEASETRHRRRRVLFIVGGALATVGIGTAVAMGVMSANDNSGANNTASQLPSNADIPNGGSTSAPSFDPTTAPPPLDPKEFVASAKKDTAPLGPDILFPGTQLTVGTTVYKKAATDDTKSCATAAQGTLPKVLTGNGCTRLMRVTYTKDDIAVTVGVAVFTTEAQATKAKGEADSKSIVKSLPGKGVKAFCNGAVCRSTTNAFGRYAYFTITGFSAGKDVTTKDTTVFRAGDDLAEFAFKQIHRRGEAQASAASAG